MDGKVKQALVVGATGGIGRAVAARLSKSGWRVRGLSRRPPAGGGGLDWRQGDAMQPSEVLAAAEGVDLIVHAANPPGYRNWAGSVLPMLQSTVAAARATGARILFPGTLYNYGPDAFPLIDEDAPQNPISRKGALRVRMEQVLAEAAVDGVPVLIVRAGDFFGPNAGNNWFAQGLVRPGRPLRAVSYPGPLEVAHAWAYLPDLAEAMVRLAERQDLAVFERFHFRGQQITGAELVAALGRVVGARVTSGRTPWWAMKAMAPWNETLRELMEVRYLWDTPVLLDNGALIAKLGAEPHTPLEQALRATLRGLGVPVAEEARLAA